MSDEHPDIPDLAGAYALDALSDDERAAFEQHLRKSASAQRDVADFRETAAELAAATAMTPPPGLRDRVLADAARTRQDAPLVPAAGAHPRRRRFAVLAAAAAAVLLVAAGTVGVLATRDSGDEVGAVLAAADVEHMALEGAMTGELSWSPSQNRSVLVMDDEMADLPDDRTYQLWYIDDGTPHPAGMFRPEDGRIVVVMDGMPEPGMMIGITEEPAGGSPAPTGPVLAGSMEPTA